MLHYSLNSAAWCSRKKQLLPAFLFHAFQTQNFMGPMNSTYIFFVTKHCCICVLSKTQTQLLRQTLSKSEGYSLFWTRSLSLTRAHALFKFVLLNSAPPGGSTRDSINLVAGPVRVY